jgi:deferrochelatase/peroxidase EfeB
MSYCRPGLPKAFEYFYFFQIDDISLFRRALESFAIPRITTLRQLLDSRSILPPSGLPKPGTQFIGFNLGFSSSGLVKLGLTDDLKDDAFRKGQRRDAKDLGDKGVERANDFYPEWDSEFLGDIHGIFQITAHDKGKAQDFLQQINTSFSNGQRSAAIKAIHILPAEFRPPPETPNEHFGFRDGISKPEIKGITFDDANPMRFTGSPVVDLGAIVLGHDGDPDKSLRPSWAVDGSFLVFRKLKSLVPEFNDFLRKEGPRIFPNIPAKKAAERLGARLFGRWKSGE